MADHALVLRSGLGLQSELRDVIRDMWAHVRGAINKRLPKSTAARPRITIPSDQMTNFEHPTRFAVERSENTPNCPTLSSGDSETSFGDGAALRVSRTDFYPYRLTGSPKETYIEHGQWSHMADPPSEEELREVRVERLSSAIRRIQERYIKEYVSTIPEDDEKFEEVLMAAMSSRMSAEEIRDMRHDIEYEMDQIRGKFGTLDPEEYR